jgi:hypothetical protein
MEPTADELAGVVDLFGALTRPELGQALAELAFKRGQEYEPGAFGDVIENAIRSYHLVAIPVGETKFDVEDPLVVVGPVAFPELPEGATDLPHILDVEPREVDRETAARAARDRFRSDAASAADAGDKDRVRNLLDVSYELEAWGSVDLAGVRDRLDDVQTHSSH